MVPQPSRTTHLFELIVLKLYFTHEGVRLLERARDRAIKSVGLEVEVLEPVASTKAGVGGGQRGGEGKVGGGG